VLNNVNILRHIRTIRESILMNVFENIPYNDEKMGHRKVVDEKHLLIMQIALKQGQEVPQHHANSNVHLLVLQGVLTVNLAGTDFQIKAGDLLPVKFQTLMKIKNTGNESATFLVIKTPNPTEMLKNAIL